MTLSRKDYGLNGFHRRWINLIMACVSSVSFSVLINGSPHGNIQSERGLRQGDPLSPYLFIICAEVLSHMINKAASTRKVHGIKICDRGPRVTHLLFADDSLFFSLVNDKSCKTLQEIFKQYEAASGQAINLHKSSITFGSRVRHDVKRRIRHRLNIHNEGGGKYLGLPK